MNPMTDRDATLAILAGGEGSRMGRPKGLLRIDDQPILAYLLARLAWSGPRMLVTAPGREHPPAAGLFTREVSDPIAGQGPLRGLATALQHTSTPLLVVATVDMPRITAEQLRWLLQCLRQRPQTAGVMLSRRIDGQEQIEPFPAAYRVEHALAMVLGQLQEEGRSVQALARLKGFDLLEAPTQWDASLWLNLNRPQDLAALQQSDPA